MPSKALGVGDKIREERGKAGLSLAQLSDATGISKAHLVRLETKPSNPSLEILHRIAEALEITVADLLGEPKLNYEAESVDVPPSLRAFADEVKLSKSELRTLASIRFRGKERPRTVKRWRYIYDSLRASESFDEISDGDEDLD